jgi:chemotaxis protein methyltransferase WspC
MDVMPVLELLRNKIGLNPESIGSASVEKIVREKVEMSGAASVREFISKLNSSAAELDGLVESVLIRETSFFRNRTTFIALQDYLRKFVLNTRRREPLRILCLPCSTGEEAYSVAMVLFDLEIPADQFSITAADISESCLKVAEAGIYKEYSFRGDDIDFREKYFIKQPDGTYLLRKKVRDAVHFERANILDDEFHPEHDRYDVIFCRNLLIYFDAAAKKKTINTLARHLSDKVALFVGHAEGTAVSHHGFFGLNLSKSFAFAKKEYAVAINEALDTNNPIKLVAPNYASAITQTANRRGEQEENGSARIQTPDLVEIASDIALARQHADAGLFKEAVTICENLLSEGHESAEVYYLLGQVAGSTEDYLMAEEYLKKAIYLNADFYDALIYLSIIVERLGQPDKAATIRSRAQRVKQRESRAENK